MHLHFLKQKITEIYHQYFIIIPTVRKKRRKKGKKEKKLNFNADMSEKYEGCIKKISVLFALLFSVISY